MDKAFLKIAEVGVPTLSRFPPCLLVLCKRHVSFGFCVNHDDGLPVDFTQYKAIVKRRTSRRHCNQPQNLLEPMHHVRTNGGKRIRPVLTMLCLWRAVGNPFYATMGGVD